MGSARASSNLVIVAIPFYLSGGRDCGFESRLGLFFTRYYTLREFGRVVKALALGTSLERGMGSNPIARTILFVVDQTTIKKRSRSPGIEPGFNPPSRLGLFV